MALDSAAIQSFAAAFQGTVVTPADHEYDTARRVWNVMIDRRPALIVRPRHAADVQAALKFTRDQGLPLAIRGGAHGIAGTGTCDDGIVIDCSLMKAIQVDVDTRTARAEPGVKWVEFDAATQAHALATTGGTVGDTGIAGLTLGGGFGWLGGAFGMTVDNLLAVDLVLADGRLVRASHDEHADLFWALRGGGGNFGVVTAFEYKLHELGPTIVGGMAIHPYPAARDVLTFYGDFIRSAPDPLTVAAALVTGPDGNKACILACTYAGGVDEGVKAVAPLKACGSPVMDMIGPLPYVAQQGLLEQASPPGLRNYWKAEFIDRVTPAFLDTWVDAFAPVASPMSFQLLFPIHGAAARVAADATAFPCRGGVHTGIYGQWKPGEPDERESVRAEGLEDEADDADERNRDDSWQVERPTVTLADVGGLDAVKRRLNIAFLAHLKDPALGKLFGKSLRGGLLLFGPPGCGKTFVARATAGEIGARFMSVGLAEVLDMWLGQSERNLHQIFRTARQNAPVVLFFDEIDALGRKRSQLSHGAGRNVVNQLLAELDGVDADNDGVFVLGATNHPWDVDTALLRPGRFDRTVLVLPPDRPAREAILRHHLKDRPVEKVDVGQIAGRTDHFSGADLAHLCVSATELALEDSIARGAARPISNTDFLRALKDVRPSTRSWFEAARNYAVFANESGLYDDLLAYLKANNLL